MIAQRIKIEGRHLTIEPKMLAVIDAKLNHIQEHYHSPINSIRIVFIGSRHHRNGALAVHMVVSIKGKTIAITKEGEQIHFLIEHAFDALDRQLLKQHRSPFHKNHSARSELMTIKHF